MGKTSEKPNDPSQIDIDWIKYLGFKVMAEGDPNPRYRNGFLIAFYMVLISAGLVACYLPELNEIRHGVLPDWMRGLVWTMLLATFLLLCALWIVTKLMLELLFGVKRGVD